MSKRVIIVGGGLSGLAAAAALAGRGLSVTVLESRNRFGGRASSFVDQTTGERVDNCQHVVLGCCTAFFHFARTVGISGCFTRERELTFVGPDGRASRLRAAPLPAPAHLLPAFARLEFLSAREKWQLARGLRALARCDPGERPDEPFLDWLVRHGQGPAAIERFWHVVLVSALSESLDRIDVAHARKVFVDAFLRNRGGWEVWLPTVPLDELYGSALQNWFAAHGVTARLQAGVARVLVDPVACAPAAAPAAALAGSDAQACFPALPRPGRTSGGESLATGVELRSGERVSADHIVLAVPHHLILPLLPGEWRQHPDLAGIACLETAPISSVHLWFDRPITPLRHAALVGRLSQWIFNRSAIQQAHGAVGAANGPAGYYYQIVISASREVTGRPQQEAIERVVEELAAVWPQAREASLRHARLVTEHRAVVSVVPGVDRFRPGQQSPIRNLQLAGDWTKTGWPGTMEGAVRSGYLAARNVLAQCGLAANPLPRELPTALLSKALLGL